MSKKLSDKEIDWYLDAIDGLGGSAVKADKATRAVTYDAAITSHESHVRSGDPEELAHAVTIALLHSDRYKYPLAALGHELHYAHGSKGSKSDEVDVLIRDADGLPYAMIELKAASEFDAEKVDAIKNQLFGTATLVGAPKLLIYATVDPKGPDPKIRCIAIDYSRHKSYDAWIEDGSPHSTDIPIDYQDLDYRPYISGGGDDLAMNSTQADFRSVAA